MNILLTGAHGFIGNYFKSNNLQNHHIKIFSFLHDDFNELNLLNIDVIVHLSALVHNLSALKDEYEKINVIQTMMLAKKAKESGVKHFLFMSSIAVYGIETGIINGKSDCSPITNYGKSKFKAELELQKLEDDDNFKIAIIRSPIVNGFKAPGNMKSLINLVKRINVLPFRGLENRRSMLHVGNLCHIMDTIIQKKIGGVFLVSDEKPLSSIRLLELIAQNLNKKIYLIKIPFFESFVKFIRPSIYKRLYESLEIDNSQTMKILFGNVNSSLPFSAEDGIKFMIHGEEIDSQ